MNNGVKKLGTACYLDFAFSNIGNRLQHKLPKKMRKAKQSKI
ncbi:hypothetical protein SAMN06265346_108215 [Flavobacterium hercynium]|nr:hypothetical protein SAMN06265346_108215 [Flavobacterium hercynium]